VYLSGANSRRIRGALAPLLKGGPLSKDAVSRLVGRLKGDFEQWRSRDLADAQLRYLMADGWHPKVRLGKRRVTVPVLVILGVRADGQRELLDLRLVGDESTAAWCESLQGLVARHIGTPVLAIIDGNPGLARRCGRRGPRCRCSGVRHTSCATRRPGAGAAPRRAEGRLSSDDLRRQPGRRGPGAPALPEEMAPAVLRTGQIKLRAIDGWQEMKAGK
jgi:hypothetical protein